MDGSSVTSKYLYVLRMTKDGNDVGIEEHQLDKFPELEAWFGNPQGHHNNNPFEEMKLVAQYVESERIVNYDTRKSILDIELNDMKRSLNHYRECVLKAEQFLGNIGYEDVKHIESFEKLDLCSFSDMFCIYGKPFLTIEYRLGHHFRTDVFLTEFDR